MDYRQPIYHWNRESIRPICNHSNEQDTQMRQWPLNHWFGTPMRQWGLRWSRQYNSTLQFETPIELFTKSVNLYTSASQFETGLRWTRQCTYTLRLICRLSNGELEMTPMLALPVAAWVRTTLMAAARHRRRGPVLGLAHSNSCTVLYRRQRMTGERIAAVL
jgi:hypothetical protein